ncbi:TPA: hypothetical protein IUD43_002000 [Escherichia coli]|uniref:hypothetical protein n=1 Tax=Escherichia sp. HH26CH TaxID=2508713 RepID=UPI00136AC5EB|nr:hypothetical protein [Escherichia sp. HH26CH]HAW0053025.1 hypothetical protein [Escherichia coli]MXC81380.1 hypothetical protein [Escherichia sp. HH26CH]HAW3029188.1 hypothetical protein [Escherichia coli]HAW4111783.1 hypothetical protein [Escherichia coli]HBC2458585.1 hypothetical protein [Escherichia coli]
MKLCFGVIDQPYDYGDEPGKTTFDVACDLEERYEIFTHFWEMHKDEIIQETGEMVAFQLIRHLKNKVPLPPVQVMGDTRGIFHRFLEAEEMAGMTINGNPVPTQAALLGVNSRLKDKYTGERRPSFIDGGLFKGSFIAWIDNNAES